MGFGGGSSGSSAISSASDVALNNPANNEVLTYDTTTSKWKNAVGGSGQVQSVNGQQGAVTLTAGQVGAVATVSPGMQLSYGTLADRPAAGQEGRFYIVIPG